MKDNIIAVLEPYEDEVLYSWVIRMIRFYNNDRCIEVRKLCNIYLDQK